MYFLLLVKIKNPPYVYIRAGKKNEVMNLVNFAEYRTYQSMIAVSQNVWKAQIEDKSQNKNYLLLYTKQTMTIVQHGCIIL